MKHTEVSNLLQARAGDRVRRKLKRLSIPERMKTLNECIPIIQASPYNLKFFSNNFSVEIGAIMMADRDIEKAVNMYYSSKGNK